MNEGLEYAQMLEIPVSTVSVVKKRSLFARRARPKEDLKAQVVESVNERIGAEESVAAELPLPEAIDEVAPLESAAFVQTEDLSAPKKDKKSKIMGGIILGEAVAACLLAAGIFLTNVFVPNTAINTFVGNLSAVKAKEAAYTDFTLTSPVSDLSDAQISVSAEGVIRFTDNTNVYPVCDGKISSVSRDGDFYTVKIAHTSEFCSVISGLDTVYATTGESVKANLPFAYSGGENEVSICMYNGEEILKCYTLSGAVPVWNS